ncbi:hypothetical protein MKY15_20825 [Sporosarcina sp. FSL K6-1540]|uniref:YqaI family protein n=1 Tax=Sporosarcina sp. FSL K6-1540 TaxID=2921555 RepID=UPI00315AEDF3
MDHPDILSAMQFGYPTNDYLEHERDYNSVNHPVIDGHPNEDIFGSEIKNTSSYFMDEKGQAVHVENIRDYLTEVVGVVFYEAK